MCVQTTQVTAFNPTSLTILMTGRARELAKPALFLNETLRLIIISAGGIKTSWYRWCILT